VSDLQAATPRHCAGIDFRDRSNEIHERGFAGAVGANEADSF
jgi:hypothetical protein